MIISITMTRDEIVAYRESRRIMHFLDDMVEQGRVTTFEREMVNQEEDSVARAAGHLDAGGRPTGGESDADAAVSRHGNYLQKKKILELHPELEDELERYINHRPYHPVPPVPSSLAGPGWRSSDFRPWATISTRSGTKASSRTVMRTRSLILPTECWRIPACIAGIWTSRATRPLSPALIS